MRTHRLPVALSVVFALLLGAVTFACCPAISRVGVRVQKQAAAQPSPPLTIAIQPLGKVPASRLEITRTAITRHFRASVTILSGRPLPREAFYAPRQRYRADKLLDALIRTTPARYSRVIGITEADISTTKGEHKDWGVFGLGYMPGRSCVVSSYRLGRNGDAARFARRLSNNVVHELGHTLGLNHCPAKGCVMQDAQGTIRTVDGETGDFCRPCREQVKDYVR